MSDRRWPPAPLSVPEPPLSDGMIALDGLRDEDAADIQAGADDADIARWIPVPVPYSLADAYDFLAHQREQCATGSALNLAIRRVGAPRLLGAIGARFEGKPGECEMGYWLRSEARGQRLTSRAIRLLAGHVFSTYDVHRVELLVHPENIASQRACEWAGCTREGLRRAASPAVRTSGYESMLVFSLLPADLS